MKNPTMTWADSVNRRTLAGKANQSRPQSIMERNKWVSGHKSKSYNPDIVTAFFKEHGIPTPLYEFQFHPIRKWRFDLAWASNESHKEGGTFIEVNGGIFIQGAHSRGAQTLKDWEKWNEAVCMWWKPLFCQPKDLCTNDFAQTIKRALGLLL